MISPISLLRILFARKSGKVLLSGLLQDAFIASEMALLPKNRLLFFFLYLIQWSGILFADRLELRPSFELLCFVRTPGPFWGSLKEARLIAPLFFGALCLAIFPDLTSPWGLPLGIAAYYFRGKLDSKERLYASNPLFSLQLFRFRKKRPPHQNGFPLLREISFAGEKQFEVDASGSPHVLFVFLESFRAKNVGALGAETAASPCFDQLAKEGVLFTQFHASGPQTFYAALSSLFGIQPALNTFHLRSYFDIPLIGLPQKVKEKGYRTAWLDGSFVSFNDIRPFFSQHGFDLISGAEDMKIDAPRMSWGIYDEALYERAVEWLKSDPRPAFGAIFTAANHHPWESPPGQTRAEDPYSRYLSTFRYTDQALGQFIENLQKEGLLEKTILFILGDHGQQMGERGANFATRVDLYQPNIHVPLLLYAKGRALPQTIGAPCGMADLFSTVCDLLALKGLHHSQGRSLLRKADSPVFFSLPSAEPRRGCRLGSYKWIGLESGGEEELYDLSQDPEERTNLSGTYPEIARQLKELASETFSLSEALFHQKKWAPQQDLSGSFFRAAASTELPLGMEGYDLSACQTMKDEELIRIAKGSGAKLRTLYFPNSPFITDLSLIALAEHCPRLTDLSILHCPLATHLGVEAILSRCPLSVLSLDQCEGIIVCSKPLPHLLSLQLGESVSADSILFCAPNLAQLTAPHLPNVSLKLLGELKLLDAEALTEERLIKILSENNRLYKLNLRNACHLKALDLRFHGSLSELTLEECPRLHQLDLDGVPVKNLTLIGCPSLVLARCKPLCRLIVHRCPALPASALENQRLY